jgi:putative alpha-1,2-mannosidase
LTSVGRKGVKYYNDLGYVPYDVKINENAARTLEYAYDDFCIYQLGKASTSLLQNWRDLLNVHKITRTYMTQVTN